jgi:Lysophospholipase
MKTLLSLIAAFACAQLAANANPVFLDQSEVGNELKIPVHAWIDQSRQPEGIIVALHGLVFSGRNLDSIGRHLSAKGFDVYAQDMRGFGDWRKPHNFAGDNLIHFTQTKEDLTRILTVLRKKYPDVPIYCMGESLGANYALWESWTEPKLMDGAILCGLSYKVDVHPKFLWVLTFFQGITHPKRPIDLIPYVKPIISHDQEVAKTCMSSEYCTTRMKISDLIKAAVTNRRAVQGVESVPQNMPILIVAGKKDQIQKPG